MGLVTVAALIANAPAFGAALTEIYGLVGATALKLGAGLC